MTWWRSTPENSTDFEGFSTFTCPADAAAACEPVGLLDRPPRSKRIFVVVGPGGAAVATWTPKCRDGCDPAHVFSQSIDPADLGF